MKRLLCYTLTIGYHLVSSFCIICAVLTILIFHILVHLQLLSSDVSSKRNSDPALVNTLNVSVNFPFFETRNSSIASITQISDMFVCFNPVHNAFNIQIFVSTESVYSFQLLIGIPIYCCSRGRKDGEFVAFRAKESLPSKRRSEQYCVLRFMLCRGWNNSEIIRLAVYQSTCLWL